MDGALVGGAGDASGAVNVTGRIESIAVGGAMLGGTGDSSGSIRGGPASAPVAVGGSVVGGTLSSFSGRGVCACL